MVKNNKVKKIGDHILSGFNNPGTSLVMEEATSKVMGEGSKVGGRQGALSALSAMLDQF